MDNATIKLYRKAIETGINASREVVTKSDDDTLTEIKKSSEVMEAFKEVLKSSEALMKENNTPDARREVATNYIILGEICLIQEKLSEAREYYEQALMMDIMLMNGTKEVADRKRAASSFERNANLMVLMDKKKESVKHYTKAVSIGSSVLDETDDADLRKLVAFIALSFAKVLMDLGKENESIEQYKKAYALYSKIVNSDNAKIYKERLKETGAKVNPDEVSNIVSNEAPKKPKHDIDIAGAIKSAPESAFAAMFAPKGEETSERSEKLETSKKHYDSAEALRKDNNYAEALPLYLKAIEISEELYKESASFSVVDALAMQYFYAGLCYRKLEKSEEAIAYYKKAINMDAEALKITPTVERYRLLGGDYYALGEYLFALEKYFDAKEYYKLAIENYSVVMESNPSAKVKTRFALCNYRVGKILFNNDVFDDAITYLDKASVVYEGLLESGEGTDIEGTLTYVYDKLSKAYTKEYKLDLAYACSKRASEMDAIIYEKNPTARNKRNIAFGYEVIMDVCAKLWNYDEALSYCEKAIEIHNELNKPKSEHTYLVSLLRFYGKAADYCECSGKDQERIKYLEKKCATSVLVYRSDNTIESCEKAAEANFELGELLYENDSLLGSRPYLEKAVELYKVILDKNPSSKVKKKLGQAKLKIAKICSKRNQHDNAIKTALEAASILGELVEAGDESFRFDFSYAYDIAGNSYSEQDKHRDAVKCYTKCVELDKAMYEDEPGYTNRKNLAISYSKLANAYMELKLYAEALKYFENAADLNEKLYDEKHEDRILEKLSFQYERIGYCAKQCGGNAKAIAYYEMALDCDLKLLAKGPTSKIHKSLFIDYNQLAILYRDEGKISKFEECLSQMEYHKRKAGRI